MNYNWQKLKDKGKQIGKLELRYMITYLEIKQINIHFIDQMTNAQRLQITTTDYEKYGYKPGLRPPTL